MALIRGDICIAKDLYQRNLCDDPSPTSGNQMYNAIKRLQLQNLMEWSDCIVQTTSQEGKVDKVQIMAYLQDFCKQFKPGSMAQFIGNTFPGVEDLAAKGVKVRDHISYAVEQERQAVSKFGKLTQSTLNGTMRDVFADMPKGFSIVGNLEGGGLGALDVKAMIEGVESLLQIGSSNITAAASALKSSFQREALSSTESTGWESLADLHMLMYMHVVVGSDPPDYKKGLTHLEEWWKQHHGINIPRRELIYGHMNSATCYNGLHQVPKAARSVIDCVTVCGKLTTSDLASDESIEEFIDWMFRELGKLDQLEIFLDTETIVWVSKIIADLPLQERLTLHGIIKRCRIVKKEDDELLALLKESRDLLLKIEAKYGDEALGRSPDDLLEKQQGLENQISLDQPGLWFF
ncbi:hypothetical protein ABW20_dc0100442 [Dactylellina cionopaga]|nr:hypothetical protein ABW20_dc0100442 [Dactylellina cionopaga]